MIFHYRPLRECDWRCLPSYGNRQTSGFLQNDDLINSTKVKISKHLFADNLDACHSKRNPANQ